MSETRQKIFAEIEAERQRQIALGFSLEKDRGQSLQHWIAGMVRELGLAVYGCRKLRISG